MSPAQGAPARVARRRLVLAVAASVPVVAPLATWQGLARTPRLEPGEFGLVDLAAVDEAGVGSVVTDPADGTYDGMWSFRNTGPVAITVRVAQRCRATTRSPTEPVRG